MKCLYGALAGVAFFANCLGAHIAAAEIIEIPGLSAGAKTILFFGIKDPRKTNVTRAVADLAKFLEPLVDTLPCVSPGDRGTRLFCTTGQVSVSTTHTYLYDLTLNFTTAINKLRALDPKRFKGAKFPEGTKQVWGVNFLAPDPSGAPCTGECNVTGAVDITLSTPVTEFGVSIDNGTTTRLTDVIVVTVNGHQLYKTLPLGITYLKLQDIDLSSGEAQPIQSVNIQPIGGATGAFILDELKYN